MGKIIKELKNQAMQHARLPPSFLSFSFLFIFSFVPQCEAGAKEAQLIIQSQRKVNISFKINVDTLLAGAMLKIKKPIEAPHIHRVIKYEEIYSIELKSKSTECVLELDGGVFTLVPTTEFNVSPKKIVINAEENLLIKEGKLFCTTPVKLMLYWVHPIRFSGRILASPENNWLLEPITGLKFVSKEESKDANLWRSVQELRYSVELKSDQNYAINFLTEDESGYPWFIDMQVEPCSIKCSKYRLKEKMSIDLNLSIRDEQEILRNVLIGAPFEIDELWLIPKPNPFELLTMENYKKYLIKGNPTWRMKVGEYLVEAISESSVYRRKLSLPTLKNCPGYVTRADFLVTLGPENRVPYSLVRTIKHSVEKKIFADTIDIYRNDGRKSRLLQVMVDNELFPLEFNLTHRRDGFQFEWCIGDTKNKVLDIAYDKLNALAKDVNGAKLFTKDTTIISQPFKLEASYSLVFSVDRYKWGSRWETEIPGQLCFEVYQAKQNIDLSRYFELK